MGGGFAGNIRSLFNARCLPLGYDRILHKVFLVLVLMYGSETRIWKEKERSRNRAI